MSNQEVQEGHLGKQKDSPLRKCTGEEEHTVRGSIEKLFSLINLETSRNLPAEREDFDIAFQGWERVFKVNFSLFIISKVKISSFLL